MKRTLIFLLVLSAALTANAQSNGTFLASKTKQARCAAINAWIESIRTAARRNMNIQSQEIWRLAVPQFEALIGKQYGEMSRKERESVAKGLKDCSDEYWAKETLAHPFEVDPSVGDGRVLANLFQRYQPQSAQRGALLSSPDALRNATAQAKRSKDEAERFVQTLKAMEKESAEAEKKAAAEVRGAQERGLDARRKSPPDKAALVWREKEALERVRSFYAWQRQGIASVLEEARYARPSGTPALPGAAQFDRFDLELTREEEAAFSRLAAARRQRADSETLTLIQREIDAHTKARIALEQARVSFDVMLSQAGAPSVQEIQQRQRAAAAASEAYYRRLAQQAEINRQNLGAVILGGLTFFTVLGAANAIVRSGPIDTESAQRRIRDYNQSLRSACRALGKGFIEPFDDSKAVGECALN